MTKLTQEIFIEKCNKKYNEKYDYSKVEFTNVRNSITIICPVHGEFKQKAKQHLYNNKTGCPKCGAGQCIATRTKTIESFKERASIRHSNYYNYDKTKYVKISSKVTITCPVHGDFEQTAASHLSGKGCKSCGYKHHSDTMITSPNFWTYTAWQTRGEKSQNFIAYSLYIIECWNDTERFIKIGKTFVDIEKRFSRKSEMPYNYKLLHVLKSDAKLVSTLETKLHADLKNQSYNPLIAFKGDSECFNINSIYNNTNNTNNTNNKEL